MNELILELLQIVDLLDFEHEEGNHMQNDVELEALANGPAELVVDLIGAGGVGVQMRALDAGVWVNE